MKWYYIALYLASIFGIFQIAQLGTFGMAPVEVLFVGFWLYLPLHLFIAGKPLRLPINLEYVALSSFVAATFISCFSVVFDGEYKLHQQVIKTMLHFLFVVGVMYMHGHLRITPAMISGILRFYLSLGIALSFYAIYQVPARIMDWPFAWIEITNVSYQEDVEFATGISQLALRFENFYRATSIYSEPSALGYASVLQIVVALVPIVRRSRHVLRTKWAVALSLSTSIVALFLAFSMTGLLVMSSCLTLIVIRYPKRVLPRLLPVLVATAIGIAAVDAIVSSYVNVSVLGMFSARIESYLTGSAFKDDIGSIAGESATQRYDDAMVAVEVWKEYPIFGYGPGCFRHHPLGRMHNSDFPSNSFATVLVDSGLVGLLSFLAMFGGFLLAAISLERRWSRAGFAEKYPEMDTVVAIAPVLMVGFLVVNFSGNNVINAVYWLHFVTVVAALQFARKALGEYREVALFGWRRAARVAQEHISEGRTV